MEQVTVQFVEIRFDDRFMVEYLDDLGSLDHFLNITVGDAQFLLLADEILRAVPCDCPQDQDHDKDPENDDHGHLPAQHQHHDEDTDHRDDGVDHLRQGLGDHFPQRVGIIRVGAHDRAVGAGVEIAQRHILHMGEHINADAAERVIGDGHHHALHGKVGKGSGDVEGCHDGQCADKTAEIRVLLPDKRNDIIIQRRFEEVGPRDRADGGKEHADGSRDEVPLVAEQVAQNAQQGLAGSLRFFDPSAAAAVACSGGLAVTIFISHYSAPFCWDS